MYSTEQLTYPPSGAACDVDVMHGPQGLSCAGFGACMVETASFGLFAVAEVLRGLAKTAGKR